MDKRVAIIQSNYIPWKGYFDIINYVDEFLLYDEAQYTRRDWRNRNRIKTPGGLNWLTIPVKVKGRYYQLIHETLISDDSWVENHIKTLRHMYARTDHFETMFARIEPVYHRAADETHLSKINYLFTTAICEILGIDTRITWSMDYPSRDGRVERLISLCQQTNATVYVSGPSAKDYMEHDLFDEANIAVEYVNYAGYPEYDQSYPPFEHGVTILDLLFHVGDDAPKYMKTFGKADVPPFGIPYQNNQNGADNTHESN